jgi:[ribosomal protein S18]-alanine N-acetyltransferase
VGSQAPQRPLSPEKSLIFRAPAPPHLQVRAVDESDRRLVASLLATSRWRHQHLDWQEPLDLLGQQPYLVAEGASSFAGCLACPEGPSGVAWVRVLGLAMGVEAATVWEALWQEARARLALARVQHGACLVSGSWQRPLLERSGFRETNAVIFYDRSTRHLPEAGPGPAAMRPLEPGDLDRVSDLDQQAFGRLWRIGRSTLEIAFRQAADASVAEIDGQLAGYQLTTLSPLGAHLARLAVDPRWQGRGIGAALVAGMLHRLHERGTTRITLNTQADNLASQELYRRLGFRQNSDRLPVFELTW